MSTGKVLAIGIDAAEAGLVTQLIEQNEMPALGSLLQQGQWLRLRSPAGIGSGTVWPTFMTGTEPTTHGIYSEWRWQPETMSLNRFDGRELTPFWKFTDEKRIRVGVFDVPFALPVGVSDGFEVSEWWAHDSTGAGFQAGPQEILSIVKKAPAHPLSSPRFVNTTPNQERNLKELTEACVAGVRLRGELARTLIREAKPALSLIVFPEIHHAGHKTWHTVEPDHRIYAGNGNNGNTREASLKEVYRAVDREIGELIDLTDRDTTILVFALHGMRPSLGIPSFLGPLLCERGFSQLTNWGSQSWRGRAVSLLAETKRHTPDNVKKLYYKLTPAAATHKLARPTMLPAYDWSQTRAFALPTDQHGWIRINLVGREARGVVALDKYEETCQEIKTQLHGLVDSEGQPLVQKIICTATDAASALVNPLPDLVVHWEDAAFAWPLRIQGSTVQVEPVGRKSTGQHAAEGFCIYHGGVENLGDVVAAKDLGRLITSSIATR
ncbi:MAG: hypothetical protein QOD75_1234 [Blastocatellia bacterium]|jgi:predicted AlkP superfamily phosphohydrolase/phosphomutase|nr:hypothetical protein [Blastocatellia bacterium]